MTVHPAPNPNERGELFEWLSHLVPPETPTSFTRLTSYVRQEAAGLIGSLQLSAHPTQRVMGFTRVAIKQVRAFRTPQESKLYKNWVQPTSAEVEDKLERARTPLPSIERLEELALDADPAILVVTGIEAIRKTHFPDLKVLSSSFSTDGEHHFLRSEYGRLISSCEDVLRSIHGDSQGSMSSPSDTPNLKQASGF